MKTIIKTTTLILFLFSIIGNINAQSAMEIMQMVYEQPNGETRKSVMYMELINKRGSKRIRTMESYSKDFGKDKKTIMFFEKPADVKGTGFLTWDYEDESKTDDRWLYLPAMNKNRRISGTSAKKEYFMGSDFTYDDMGNRNLNADNHKILKEEVYNGKNCWVIESSPKVSDNTYSKKVSWIQKESFMASKVEFYNIQGSLSKVLEVNKIEKIDGFWVAKEMLMKNHTRNHSTIIRIESIVFNIDISDNAFTVTALEKGYIN